ncbi:MAG: spherulation-specific family 4 protein [Gemmataceae bacterium]|nr:spherulation-specific family 4 protein [Gemmataceae bacterium]
MTLLLLLLSADAPRLLVPAYFPVPAGKASWDALIAAQGKAGIIAIVNVGEGKGKGVAGGPFIPKGWDAAVVRKHYSDVLGRAAKKGVRLVGYVSTARGTRPLADAKADLDEWKARFPGVSGVFLDEQAVGTPDKPGAAKDALPWYKALRAHALAGFGKAALVVSNPGNTGSRPDDLRPYAEEVAGLVVMYEGTRLADYAPPAWTAKLPRARFAALLHTTALPATLAADLRKKRIGVAYCTDAGKDGNPWPRLPSYWAKLPDAVRAE